MQFHLLVSQVDPSAWSTYWIRSCVHHLHLCQIHPHVVVSSLRFDNLFVGMQVNFSALRNSTLSHIKEIQSAVSSDIKFSDLKGGGMYSISFDLPWQLHVCSRYIPLPSVLYCWINYRSAWHCSDMHFPHSRHTAFHVIIESFSPKGFYQNKQHIREFSYLSSSRELALKAGHVRELNANHRQHNLFQNWGGMKRNVLTFTVFQLNVCLLPWTELRETMLFWIHSSPVVGLSICSREQRYLNLPFLSVESLQLILRSG
jgi:hypothetical protein